MNGQTSSQIDIWLRRLMRYGVGGGGLTWAIITDHLNPVIWMVLGSIATSTDLVQATRRLIKAAREEGQWLEREHERQRRQEREPPPLSPPPTSPET